MKSSDRFASRRQARLGTLELEMISVGVAASGCRPGLPRCWTLVSDLDGDLARAPAEPVMFEIFRFVARIPNNIGMLIRNRY
jgi:hypothetical protein